MNRTPLVIMAVVTAGALITLSALRGTNSDRSESIGRKGEGERSELSELKTKVTSVSSGKSARQEQTRTTAIRTERPTTNSRTLTGRVTLPDGSPVAMATVSTNGGTSATTDAEGKYLLEDLPNQVWRISASRDDCVTSVVRGLARGQDTLDFVLTRKIPVLFVGKVVAAGTKQPLVQFTVNAGQREVVKSSTQQGNFEIRGLFSGEEIGFRIESPGLTARVIREWIPGDSAGTIEREYEMGAGGTITGRIVRIGDKSPVAGAGIRSQSFSRRGGGDSPTTATSGPDGKFHLAQLSPGVVRLQVFPDAPLVEVSRFIGEIQHGAVRDVGDIEVGEGGTIRGKLVKVPGNQPVQGERVELGGGRGFSSFGSWGGFGGQGGPGQGSGGQGTTGTSPASEGRGGFGGRRGGGGNGSAVAAASPDSSSASTSTTVTTLAANQPATPPSSTGGEAGRSAWTQRRDNDTSFVITSADGSFEFTQIPPNRYQLAVRKYELRESVNMEGEETENITLRIGDGTLRGLLVKDGNPVAGEVDLYRQTGGQTIASEDVEESGTFEIEGLAPGHWRIRIEPEEGRDSEQEFEMPASGILERTFVIPSGDIVGRVVDQQDQPVAGASISLLTKEQAQTFSSWGRGGRGGGGRRVESDGEGNFRIQDREPGETALYARKDGVGASPIVDVTVPDSGDTHEVLLKLGDGPVGTLVSIALNLDNGAPIREAWCTLTSEKGTITPRQNRSEEGVATINDLPAGSYKVQVSARGFTSSEHSVEIREGQRTEITSVIGPAGSVRLSLVDHNGSGVANVQCVLQPNDPNSIESTRQGMSDSSGVWTLRGLQPGTYTLTYTRPGGSPTSTQLRVDAGGITQETLQP